MKVETQFKINKLLEKVRNCTNSYEKKRYHKQIRLLRDGKCHECEQELNMVDFKNNIKKN